MLHLARSEGHERYFGCNVMHRKVLASSYQHLMAEAPRIPVLASLPLVPRNQDIEHRRETSHRKPCGVIRAPRRPLTLDEQPELLPKEKIHCGEGAARAAQGCERMRQRPGQ